jgi:hypothetical protein
VNRLSTICFAAAMVGFFVANGVSHAMKRLVYNRSGKTLRPLSTKLVREYRSLYGKDRNYWVYCVGWLVACLGLAGFAFFPK